MPWKNRLIKKAVSTSPVVEQTPVVWKGRLLLVETWQRQYWDNPPTAEPYHCLRVRDQETNKVLCYLMDGYGFSSAFVWKDTMHVFASKYTEGGGMWTSICTASSTDLKNWTKPRRIVPNEQRILFNTSVCWDGNRFVMAIEGMPIKTLQQLIQGYSADICPNYLIRFYASKDLRTWSCIPSAQYGGDRCTACPTIRHVGGYYYMLYTGQVLPKWRFDTFLTRSKDLVHWEDAPHGPVISPDTRRPVLPECPPWKGKRLRECNASDPDLVEWKGKTRVYFTGGHQHWGGQLQYAEFPGNMRAFFESYYL